MALYYCNQQEIAGVVEHMGSSKVVTALGSIPNIKDEQDDHKEAHTALADFFRNQGKEPVVLPKDFEAADSTFDSTVRAYILYVQHLIERPKFADVQDRLEALLERLFPLGRSTVNLGYAEEVAVAARVNDIVSQDNEVSKLVANTEIPALTAELAKAGNNLQKLLQNATPQVAQQISYREVRTAWINALGDLQDRVERVLQRMVRKGTMKEAVAEQLRADIFHAVDEAAAKSARRRSTSPSTDAPETSESPAPEQPNTTAPSSIQ